MLTILPPPRSRITGTTARQVRNIDATLTSITCRHSSSGISVERTHRERGVEAGVVDEDVDAAVPVDRLAHHRLDVGLAGHVGADPALGRVEVGDDDGRALAPRARRRSPGRSPARRR